MEFVIPALILLAMGALWWVGYRMEPHWISRDGTRFMCGAQEFFHGTLAGHPRETHVAILNGGAMHVTQKRMMRRKKSLWELVGKSADPPKGLEIFVIQQTVDGTPTSQMMALRVPKKSKLIAVLDAQLEKKGYQKSASVNIETPKTS